MERDIAIGYMIIAAKQLGLDKQIIKDIESGMREVMDYITEEDAEMEYMDFI